jgi:hypothetical protein
MNVRKLLIILLALISYKIFSQSDTISVNPNKLIENPIFFGVQIEAVTTIATNEIGISGDYDFFTSVNKKYNFGLRISTEYYKISDFDVGGGSTYGPYWDFSILGRHSLRGKYFWFSPLIGLSFHNSMADETLDSKIVLKWGLELKYNLYKENIGLLLKFLVSPTVKKGYGGIGISIGLY